MREREFTPKVETHTTRGLFSSSNTTRDGGLGSIESDGGNVRLQEGGAGAGDVKALGTLKFQLLLFTSPP